MLALTREQARVKSAIAHLSRDGFAPSYEEIGEEVGCSKSRVLMHLRSLRDRGHVDFEDRRARSVRIIGALEGLADRSTPDLRALRDNIDKILKERSQ